MQTPLMHGCGGGARRGLLGAPGLGCLLTPSASALMWKLLGAWSDCCPVDPSCCAQCMLLPETPCPKCAVPACGYCTHLLQACIPLLLVIPRPSILLRTCKRRGLGLGSARDETPWTFCARCCCCCLEGRPLCCCMTPTVSRGIFCTVAFVLLSQDSAMAASASAADPECRFVSWERSSCAWTHSSVDLGPYIKQASFLWAGLD